MASMPASRDPFAAPASRAAPKLALVLGSGGVRSAAAAGILSVLHEQGLQPDLVVGCSSGAVFGAAIALGLSPQDVLQLAARVWTPDLTRQHRWRAYAQLLAPRLAGFDAGFSLRRSDRIARTLTDVFGSGRIEALPIALRITATDAASGAPVVLHHGALAPALMASMAVPFVFPSVNIDGRRLMDGVLSDPLPLAAAGDASICLALDMTGPLPRRIDRASRLLLHVSTAMINNLQDARTAAAAERALAQGQRILRLTPSLPQRVGLWDTRAFGAMFEAGRRAAQDRLADITAALTLAPLWGAGATLPTARRAA